MRPVNCRRRGIVAVEEVPWGDGKRTLTKAYMLFLGHNSKRSPRWFSARPGPGMGWRVIREATLIRISR